MPVDDSTVAEFQVLYERSYDVTINADRARELVHRLLSLYDLLLRPTPKR